MWKRAIAVTTLSLVAYHALAISGRKRILAAIQARAYPYNPHIAQWKRDAIVCGLMHLAGNRPRHKVN